MYWALMLSIADAPISSASILYRKASDEQLPSLVVITFVTNPTVLLSIKSTFF